MEGLGINEDTIIEQTHQCLKQSLDERRSFDERFRRHIVHARDLLELPRHKRADISALKRSLEGDQTELKEIDERMALCKDNIMSVLRIKAAEYSAQVRSAGGSLASANAAIDEVSQQRSTPSSSSPSSHAPASFSELKSSQQSGPMIPSAMLKPQLEQQAAPMFTTITLQPASQPVAPQQPIVASFAQPMQPIVQQQQQQLGEFHEIGMQRHFDSAPNPLHPISQPQQQASVLYQPRAASHLPSPSMFKYYEQQLQQQQQPLAFNRLASYPGEMVRQSYQMSRQQPSLLTEQYHGVREPQNLLPSQTMSFNYFKDQRQQPSVVQRPYQQQPQMSGFKQNQYFIQQQQRQQQQNAFINNRLLSSYQETFPAHAPLVAAYASPNQKPAKAVSHPDHHHSSTDSNTEEGKDDWSSKLWFPGTTYSPPPSWLRAQKSLPNPYVSHQPMQQEPQQQHQQQEQPQLYNAIVPFAQHLEDEHPLITQIAGAQSHHEGDPGEVAPFSSLKPYNPFAATAEKETPKQFFQPALAPAPFIGVPLKYPNPAIYPSFASPQNSAHEIIKAGPQPVVETINKIQQQQPTNEDKGKDNGALPGYLGALDVAKYPTDSTDRLRGKEEEQKKQGNENEQKGKGFHRILQKLDQIILSKI